MPAWPFCQALLFAFHVMCRPVGGQMKDEFEDQIRTRAHQLWELAGMPDGKEEQFWLEAERELKEKKNP